MGILSGSMNLFRIYFNEEFNLNTLEMAEVLEQYSYDKLFDEFKPVNYGFVPFEYPEMDSFLDSSILYGDNILFSVRYDEKRINSKYYKTELITMKKKFLQENKKEFLSKMDVEFLKNTLTNRLVKSSIPNTSIIEILFVPEKKEIYVSNISSKIFESIVNLFRIAFDINIYQETLVELSKRLLHNPSKVDQLLTLNPSFQ
jgi:DNA recombination-dependent growth factor C